MQSLWAQPSINVCHSSCYNIAWWVACQRPLRPSNCITTWGKCWKYSVISLVAMRKICWNMPRTKIKPEYVSALNPYPNNLPKKTRSFNIPSSAREPKLHNTLAAFNGLKMRALLPDAIIFILLNFLLTAMQIRTRSRCIWPTQASLSPCLRTALSLTFCKAICLATRVLSLRISWQTFCIRCDESFTISARIAVLRWTSSYDTRGNACCLK